MERLGWGARLLWARPVSCSTKPFPPQRPQEPFSSLFFLSLSSLILSLFLSLPSTDTWFLPAGNFLSLKPKKRRAHISKERKRERNREGNFYLSSPPFINEKKYNWEENRSLFIKRPNIPLRITCYSPVGPLFRSSSHCSYNCFWRQSVVSSTPPPPFLQEPYSLTFEPTT